MSIRKWFNKWFGHNFCDHFKDSGAGLFSHITCTSSPEHRQECRNRELRCPMLGKRKYWIEDK